MGANTAWADVTWTFSSTAFTSSELTNIKADGAAWSQTTENTRYTYQPVLSEATALSANGTELDFTKGLKFITKANGIRLYSNNSIELYRPAVVGESANANASYIVIPNVPKDATVEVKFKPNTTTSIQIVSDELADVESPSTTGDIVTYKGTVKSEGDVKIGYKIATGTVWCMIRSISYTVSHNVTVLYNGEGAYGTAAATASSVEEGSTTTITASPETGYKVTNWTVSGTGATIDPSGDSNSNTTTLTMGTADATVTCTFAPQTYTVTNTLTNASKTSGATTATYNSSYSAVFTANDGYVLPSAITVSIGGEEKTVDTDYTWNQATGTVTIPAEKVTGDIEITVTATKAIVTKVWTFEQFEGTKDGSNDREVITSTSGTSVFNYNGLYIHNNGGGHTVGARVQNSIMSLLNSGTTSITVTDGECATFSGIAASASNFAVDCYAIETPGAGTVSVKTYAATSGNGIRIFSGTTLKVTYSASANKETHISTYTTNGVETIWIVPTGNIYLQEVSFVPIGYDEGATKTFTISAAGYATFGATENYTWDTTEYPNLKAYYVSGVSSTSATMTEISAANGIPANVGVIFAGDEGTYKLTTVKTATSLGGTNYLKACLADYSLRADNSYTNAKSEEISATTYNYTLAVGPTFMHSSGEGTLAAGKAFLRTTVNVTGGEAKALRIVVDGDEATGVEAPAVSEVGEDEVLYNMAGLRVGKDYKGIVINKKGVKRFNK